MTKYTEISDEAIVDRYESWEGTITELADELEISRQRIYNALDRLNVTPKSRRVGAAGVDLGPLLPELSENALAFLVDQLYDARRELERYRAKYGPL